jgi:hypothetical protein
MFLKTVKIFLLTMVMLFQASKLDCRARSKGSLGEDKLAATVKDFLTIWLVERDAKGVMKYISTSPILSKCAAPDELDENYPLSREEIVPVFQKAFANVLNNIPSVHQLSNIVGNPHYIPANDRKVTFVEHSNDHSTGSKRKPGFKEPVKCAQLTRC